MDRVVLDLGGAGLGGGGYFIGCVCWGIVVMVGVTACGGIIAVVVLADLFFLLAERFCLRGVVFIRGGIILSRVCVSWWW